MWGYAFVVLTIVLTAFLWWQWRRNIGLARENETLQQNLNEVESQRHSLQELSYAERQTLFNSMIEGVVLLDDTNRIQLINRSLEQQFGLAVDIRRQTVLEAFRLPQLEALVTRLQIEQSVREEIEWRANPPRLFEVNAARVFGRDGKAQGAILVFHDLTQIRELENTRREFVANVSHELRTPLSLIKGYVETLLDGAKDDPELVTRFLHTIDRNSKRLHSLIEDLLTISRLESGQITLQLRPLPLRAFANNLLDELRTRAHERTVTIDNLIPDHMEVRADADRLEQVLVNLVDNAIKYGRAGGSVKLESRTGPGYVELCIADDGPGIPLEAQDRIFERFYRVDRARSREAGGTGLGLSIVKHIIQSHGGKVWVESTPGRGANFFFTLPA